MKEQLSLYLLHEKAYDLQVVTGRFAENSSIFFSVLNPFLGVVLPMREGETYKRSLYPMGNYSSQSIFDSQPEIRCPRWPL